MRRHLQLLLVASVMLSSCFGAEIPPPDDSLEAFDGRGILTASPNRVVLNTSVTLTSRFMPKYSGRGRLLLGVHREGVVVEAPVWDTITGQKLDSVAAIHRGYETEVDVEFIANQEHRMDWSVRMSLLRNYPFHVRAYLDSMYVPDSARWYAVGTPEVQNLIGNPNGGLDNLAHTNDIDLYP